MSALVNGCEFLEAFSIRLRELVTKRDLVEIEREVKSLEDAGRSMGSTCLFMSMMINRCIDYTKVSHGLMLSPRYDVMNLLSCVKACVNCIEDFQSKIPIEVEPLPDEIELNVETDKQWVEESLLCMLSNAIKFTSYGKVKVRLSRLELDGTDMIRVEVQDSGIGVPDALQPYLFHANLIRQDINGGAGLGLYSIAHRMDALRGTYGMTSPAEGGHGSIFWFAFPYNPFIIHEENRVNDEPLQLRSVSHKAINLKELADDLKSLNDTLMEGRDHDYCSQDVSHSPLFHGHDKEDISTRLQSMALVRDSLGTVMESSPKDGDTARITAFSTIHPVAASSSHSNSQVHSSSEAVKHKHRVLVVDDSMPILKMTRKMLERDGHTVVEAVNGQDAVDCVRLEAFDVILMDIQMPVMGGIEATKIIRSEETDGSTSNSFKSNNEGQDNSSSSAAVGQGHSSYDEFPLQNNTLINMITSSFHEARGHQVVASLDNRLPTIQTPKNSFFAGLPSKVVIIGCSANSDHITVQEAFEAGMDDFIPKPVTLRKFNEVANKHLIKYQRKL